MLFRSPDRQRRDFRLRRLRARNNDRHRVLDEVRADVAGAGDTDEKLPVAGVDGDDRFEVEGDTGRGPDRQRRGFRLRRLRARNNDRHRVLDEVRADVAGAGDADEELPVVNLKMLYIFLWGALPNLEN